MYYLSWNEILFLILPPHIERVDKNYERYNTKLYYETDTSAINVKEIKPEYDQDPEIVDGRIILRESLVA